MSATQRYISDQVDGVGPGCQFLMRYIPSDPIVDWTSFDQDNDFFGSSVDLDTSIERTEADRHKDRIVGAIRDMQQGAPDWHNQDTTVLPGSAAAAELFISALPENRTLPKVAADGDGDVMFVWEGEDECIITVDAKSLHLVKHPGSPDALHLTQPFRGVRIPVAILQHMPFK